MSPALIKLLLKQHHSHRLQLQRASAWLPAFVFSSFSRILTPFIPLPSAHSTAQDAICALQDKMQPRFSCDINRLQPLKFKGRATEHTDRNSSQPLNSDSQLMETQEPHFFPYNEGNEKFIPHKYKCWPHFSLSSL